jgi:hypothetical protein
VETEAWLRWLRAISDPEIRIEAIGDWLVHAEAVQVVRILDALVAMAEARDSASRIALTYLVTAQAVLDVMRREELYEAALKENLSAAKRLILAQRLPRHGQEPSATNRFIDKSLGERKALARRSERSLIERLSFDLHPAVIRILLGNPRLLESDVVKMAAMKPTRAEVLIEIARAQKWVTRHAVKKALVCNPHLPEHAAHSLLACLSAADWRELATQSGAREDMRAAARALLGHVLH